MAEDLHQRERTIKAARGRIIDANGVVIADNRTVCTISVIYNQVTDREHVIQVLCSELGLDEELVRKRVEKRSSREIIKTNVDKELGDKIRAYRLDGQPGMVIIYFSPIRITHSKRRAGLLTGRLLRGKSL